MLNVLGGDTINFLKKWTNFHQKRFLQSHEKMIGFEYFLHRGHP